MRYIIIVHEKKEPAEIFKAFGKDFDVLISDECVYIGFKKNNAYIQIEYEQELESEFEEDERIMFSKLKSSLYAFIKYSDIPSLKVALELIVKNVDCYIDNDHGILLKGGDFMKKWSLTPSWNWDINP